MLYYTAAKPPKGNHMGNDSITAFRTREQLRKFLGIFSPRFSKPKLEFLGQMLFGIQAARDTLVSEIARSLQEDILAKKTQERLERHLRSDGLDDKVHGSILCDAASSIHEDTLIVIDPTDVQKPYAEKMPYLAKVWDGSEGKVGDNLGYTLCMAIACENGCRRIVPLMLRLWSSEHPEYASENDEVCQVVGQIASATNNRGIFVYARGGDGDKLFKFYIDHGYGFIVRLVGDRNLLNWGGKTKDSQVLAETLAKQCTLKYEDSVHYRSHNKVHNIRIKYGSMPVRLPVRPEADLRLVVVKWPKGEKPMMLLTTLNAVRTRQALWPVVQGYITRWRVEDTIRFIKQSYRLEHMRLLDYQRLKNMSALVVAVAYFAAAWLGKKVKLEALANHVAKVSRKMFEVPEFFYYAIADGLRWLFVRHGKWRGLDCAREERGDLQMEFELLTG